MIFNFNNAKSKRKAKNAWEKILIKTGNYFNNPEEIRNLSFTERAEYELRMASGACLYPREKTKEEIRNLARTIHEISEIKKSCSFGTIYKSVKHELQSELSLVLESNSLRDFETVLESLFSRVRSSIQTYDFYFSLEGIELVDISVVDFDSIQILKFDRELMDEILCEDDKASHNHFHIEFINKNFLDRVCIKCRCSGDFEFSKKRAELKARETINYCRYMICLLFYQRIYENLLKISIVSETYVDENQILAREVISNKLSLHWDSTRRASENFPINKERVDELKNKLYFEMIVRILNCDTQTELEGCVLTAMYWSGEAQNEFDWDIAFLKYWTALEAIFSHRKGNITSSLTRGISILAAFGGYQFIQPYEINQVSKSVSNLYDKRSGIVHRGLRNSVNEVELIEICKYASWMILTLMRFISIGYKNIIQLNEQIVRLYEIHISSKNEIAHMETKTITIRVNAEVARIFEAASEEERRKFEALLSLKLGEATRSKRPLEEVMSEISRNAQARGLTPEILDSILNEE